MKEPRVESLRSKTAVKKTVFKTVFDSPLIQWTLPSEVISRDILEKTLTELVRYVNHFSRSSSEHSVKRPRLEPTTSTIPILIGLNQVTRALEEKKLAIVLACKDDLQNPQILYHIPFLGRLSGAIVVPLPKGSTAELSSLLNLPRVTVIGIKPDESIQSFIDYIRKRIPPETDDLSDYRSVIVHKVPVITNPKKATRRKKCKVIGNKKK